MGESGHLVALVFAVVALVVKLVALWRDPGNPATRAICGILFGFALAVTTGWTPVYAAIDRATGIPNLAKLLEHAAALIAVASIQILFLYLGDPAGAGRRLRGRLGVLAILFVAMVVAFWAAPVDVSEPVHFSDRYAALPHIALYTVAYLLYFAVALADILRMSWRYAPRARTGLVRFSIRLLSAGSVLGFGYVGHKILFLCVRGLGGTLPWSEPAASQLFITTSVACLATSFTLPAMGTAIAGGRSWLRHNRLYRRLHPLWRVLHEAVPDVVLDPPRWPARNPFVLIGIRTARYRRHIEIRDGLQLVRPFMRSAVAEEARRRARRAGLTARQVTLAGEAAAILAAARSMATHAGHGCRDQRQEVAEPTVHADLDVDAVWLGEVAAMLTAPAVVEAVSVVGANPVTRP